MKRSIILLIIFAFVFFNSGCRNQKANNSSYIEKAHQNIAVGELSYKSNWLKNGLSKIGLNNVTVAEKVEIHYDKDNSASPRYAYLICDYERYGEKSIYHDCYLAIETHSKVLLKDITGKEYGGSYGDEIFARDIDGDKVDEIILQQIAGMTGGAGQYRSRIFKVVDDKITEIFVSETGNLFDTGFIGVVKNDYKLELQNRFTNYSKTLDLSAENQYIGVYFDVNGNAISNAKNEILCDSFREFVPEDIDGDGIFEIACLQYVSLYGHSDYIGDAKSVLKFNPNKQEFDIIKVEFIEA